jgi:hypothetical protein
MTDIIDPTKTYRLLEERIAKTTNPRHLLMLQRVLQHAIGESKLDLDLVMSTLGPNPRYVAWGAPADMSPVGREAVQGFYEETIVKGGQWFLELDMDRIVVDDETVVTEGDLRSLYYGADAAKRGFPVDDPTGFYLLTLRMLRLAVRCRWLHHRRGNLFRHHHAQFLQEARGVRGAAEVPRFHRHALDAD